MRKSQTWESMKKVKSSVTANLTCRKLRRWLFTHLVLDARRLARDGLPRPMSNKQKRLFGTPFWVRAEHRAHRLIGSTSAKKSTYQRLGATSSINTSFARVCFSFRRYFTLLTCCNMFLRVLTVKRAIAAKPWHHLISQAVTDALLLQFVSMNWIPHLSRQSETASLSDRGLVIVLRYLYRCLMFREIPFASLVSSHLFYPIISQTAQLFHTANMLIPRCQTRCIIQEMFLGHWARSILGLQLAESLVERNQGRSEPWGKLAPKWDGPLKVDQHLGVDPQVCLKIGYPNILEQIRASPTGPSLRHRSRKWGMIYNNLLCIRINKEIYIYI